MRFYHLVTSWLALESPVDSEQSLPELQVLPFARKALKPYHFHNSYVLLVHADDALWRSPDSGSSWTKNVSPRRLMDSLAFDPGHDSTAFIQYGGTGPVWSTTDRAETWKTQMPIPPLRDTSKSRQEHVELHPTNGNISLLYVKDTIGNAQFADNVHPWAEEQLKAIGMKRPKITRRYVNYTTDNWKTNSMMRENITHCEWILSSQRPLPKHDKPALICLTCENPKRGRDGRDDCRQKIVISDDFFRTETVRELDLTGVRYDLSRRGDVYVMEWKRTGRKNQYGLLVSRDGIDWHHVRTPAGFPLQKALWGRDIEYSYGLDSANQHRFRIIQYPQREDGKGFVLLISQTDVATAEVFIPSLKDIVPIAGSRYPIQFYTLEEDSSSQQYITYDDGYTLHRMSNSLNRTMQMIGAHDQGFMNAPPDTHGIHTINDAFIREDSYGPSDLWISKDGGLFWKRLDKEKSQGFATSEGNIIKTLSRWKHNAKDIGFDVRIPSVISFSADYGETWSEILLSQETVYDTLISSMGKGNFFVSGLTWQLTPETEEERRKPVSDDCRRSGQERYCEKPFAYKLNFNYRPCRDEESDIEWWTTPCGRGQRWQHARRKPDAKCWVGYQFESKILPC